MTIKLAVALFSLVAVSGATSAKESPNAAADYGKQPTFANAVIVGEAFIKARLVDPDSAKFEWPYNFRAVEMKGLFSKRRAGYVTCGYVNSRNRMGGYSGRSVFYIMENDGAVTDFTMDESSEITKLAEAQCTGLSKNPGFLFAPTAAPLDGRRPIGIQFQPTQIGILVMSVTPGSPGEKAGIKVGQIIEAVNGKKTSGLSPTEMISLVQNASSPTMFSMMNGVAVTVDRPPLEASKP